MKRALHLERGEIAIVGYGSLFSHTSVSKTLGRDYDGPFLVAQLNDWRRRWNAAMPNAAYYHETGGERVYPEKIVYLNVRRVPGATMNCVVFVIRQSELAAMDDREWIYDRTVVTSDVRDVLIVGGDALMYVAKPEFVVENVTSTRQAAIRASYIRILDSAFSALPGHVRADYDRSTDAIPKGLVIDDRLDPARQNPWTAAGHRHSPTAHTPRP